MTLGNNNKTGCVGLPSDTHEVWELILCLYSRIKFGMDEGLVTLDPSPLG